MVKLSYQSGLLFTQAHKLVRFRIYDVLEPYDLNPSYWSILGATVNNPDGIQPAAVAEVMDVKAPLVTMLSNDLIEKGLIKRIPHPTDKRAKLLIATPEGKKLRGKLEQLLEVEINSLLDGLTASEVATFEKALGKIIENSAKK